MSDFHFIKAKKITKNNIEHFFFLIVGLYIYLFSFKIHKLKKKKIMLKNITGKHINQWLPTFFSSRFFLNVRDYLKKIFPKTSALTDNSLFFSIYYEFLTENKMFVWPLIAVKVFLFSINVPRSLSDLFNV